VTRTSPAIIALAPSHRLPAVYSIGVSMSRSVVCPTELDFVDVFRQAASYVDRTCGDEPAELPVQLATKFETVLTLKRPRRSLTMPPGLLVADEVGGGPR
jgi:putative ABC transport system substrate-binding protein